MSARGRGGALAYWCGTSHLVLSHPASPKPWTLEEERYGAFAPRRFTRAEAAEYLAAVRGEDLQPARRRFPRLVRADLWARYSQRCDERRAVEAA